MHIQLKQMLKSSNVNILSHYLILVSSLFVYWGQTCLLVFTEGVCLGSGWDNHCVSLTPHRLLCTEIWQGESKHMYYACIKHTPPSTIVTWSVLLRFLIILSKLTTCKVCLLYKATSYTEKTIILQIITKKQQPTHWTKYEILK